MTGRALVLQSTLLSTFAITLFLARVVAFRGVVLASASSFSRQRTLAFSSSSSLAMTSYPVPRREEDRVFYAGVPPPGWDMDVLRQSEESDEKLMDPPVAVIDPYGWMKDMKRENPEVLDHLKAENEYTQSVIAHLEPLQKKLYDEFLSSIKEVSTHICKTIDNQRAQYSSYCTNVDRLHHTATTWPVLVLYSHIRRQILHTVLSGSQD
jgi:Prolyl oligopeptidase, N-terminal beta-propeller domain